MKYQISLLIISILIISSFSFYDAYAANSLSFDQTRIVIEHSGIISCIDCTGAGGAATITANLTGPSVPNGQSITLNKIGATSDYSSSFIKFTTSPSGPLDFQTAVGQQITVTASGFTQNSAQIFSTNSLSPNYDKSKKLIQPLDSAICSKNGNGGDTDGDGICDTWENNTNYTSPCPISGPGLCIRTSSTATPYFIGCTPGATDFRNICPSYTKADLYYEIDWMLGHKPSDDVINDVAKAFKDSNYVPTNCPSCSSGINFHAQLDEELPHITDLKWPGLSTAPGFDQLKYWWFGTAAERTYSWQSTTNYVENVNSLWIKNNLSGNQRGQKAQVFHYAIFGHNFNSLTSSGKSDPPGNDVLITLGSFAGQVGSKDYQKATLLHEIGHNLNLKHGGDEPKNCKPNYVSIMSYSRQFPTYVNDRPLDFSREKLDTISETPPNETTGVGAAGAGYNITFSTPSGIKSYVVDPSGSVDWNKNNAIGAASNQDLNNFGIEECLASSDSSITGFKDWAPSTSPSGKMILGPMQTGGAAAEQDQSCFSEDCPSFPFFDDINNPQIDDVMNPELVSELTPEDVNTMHISRIDSLISELDNIPDSDLGNINDVRSYLYKKELDEVKNSLEKNNSEQSTMSDVYFKMLEFKNRLDGQGSDEIISNDATREQILNLINDIIISQSRELGYVGEFNQSVTPVEPASPNISDLSPLKQTKNGILPKDVTCKSSMKLLLKYSEKPACVKETSIKRLTSLGWAEPFIANDAK